MASSRGRLSGIAGNANMNGIPTLGSARRRGTKPSGWTLSAIRLKDGSHDGGEDQPQRRTRRTGIRRVRTDVQGIGRRSALGPDYARIAPSAQYRTHRTGPILGREPSRSGARGQNQHPRRRSCGEPSTDEKGFAMKAAVALVRIARGNTVRPAPPRQRFPDLTHGADSVL